jgi:hypothetical protein
VTVDCSCKCLVGKPGTKSQAQYIGTSWYDCGTTVGNVENTEFESLELRRSYWFSQKQIDKTVTVILTSAVRSLNRQRQLASEVPMDKWILKNESHELESKIIWSACFGFVFPSSSFRLIAQTTFTLTVLFLHPCYTKTYHNVPEISLDIKLFNSCKGTLWWLKSCRTRIVTLK